MRNFDTDSRIRRGLIPLPELKLKHFLVQLFLWFLVAAIILSVRDPFGISTALWASLLLTAFLGFVTFKLFSYFDRAQKVIAAGVTTASALVLALLVIKFYVFDIHLKMIHLFGLFFLPAVIALFIKQRP